MPRVRKRFIIIAQPNANNRAQSRPEYMAESGKYIFSADRSLAKLFRTKGAAKRKISVLVHTSNKYWTISVMRVLCEGPDDALIWHEPEGLSPEED